MCSIPTCPDFPNCPIPHGLCHCGCGEKTPIAQKTDLKAQQVKGEPIRYIRFHSNRGRTGERAGRWAGGIKMTPQGYVLRRAPNHPHASAYGYVMEHRLVMEAHLGRYLDPAEKVHHRGTRYPHGDIRNRSDNRLENLELMPSQAAHMRVHTKYFRSETHKECSICHHVLERGAFDSIKNAKPGADPHESRCSACNRARVKAYKLRLKLQKG